MEFLKNGQQHKLELCVGRPKMRWLKVEKQRKPSRVEKCCPRLQSGQEKGIYFAVYLHFSTTCLLRFEPSSNFVQK